MNSPAHERAYEEAIKDIMITAKVDRLTAEAAIATFIMEGDDVVEIYLMTEDL